MTGKPEVTQTADAIAFAKMLLERASPQNPSRFARGCVPLADYHGIDRLGPTLGDNVCALLRHF